MGMFTTIKIEQPCPNCGISYFVAESGRKVPLNWQSKHLYLDYKGRDVYIGDGGVWELDENISGVMYTSCEELWGGCGKWIEYEISKGKLIRQKIANSYMEADEVAYAPVV